MQSPSMAPPETTNLKWYRTRTAISGLLILGFAIGYIGIIAPADNVLAPGNYRFPFSFETSIYVIVACSLAVHWFYRLARPASVETRADPVSKLDVLGMVLKSALVVTILGSYLTGAMIASPQLFASITSISFVGQSVAIFANYIHTTFAGLLVAFVLAILVFEILRIVTKHGTIESWLAKPRYLETKITYWCMGVAVIIQGTLGLFLAGTFSSIGPYGLLGLNTYSFETLVRHIHGPFGAVVFMTVLAAVYFRVRPEFSIR